MGIGVGNVLTNTYYWRPNLEFFDGKHHRISNHIQLIRTYLWLLVKYYLVLGFREY